MSLTQHSLLKFGLAMMLISCTSSRNPHVTCQTAKDCSAGYMCEQVPNTDANFSVCCKDKGCASGTTPGPGVDGPSDLVTSHDGQSFVVEASTVADTQSDDPSLDSRSGKSPSEIDASSDTSDIGTCMDQAACCDLAADCPPRSDAVITCSGSHKCVYTCNAGATKLGCQCTAGSAPACNGPAQKLVVSCVGGVWTDIGTSCGQTQNCDTGTGTCVTIPSDCVGHSPGYTFCGANYTPIACGPDLTTTLPQTPCSGLCSGGTCQTAFCGDGRKESGEECDDGNTIAADGCETSCHNSAVLSLALGFQHSCALLRDGYVRCWGANDQMQLGLGHKNQEWDRNPYQLTDASGNSYVGPISLGGAVSAIAAGDNHTCAILSSSGAVRCWGANNAGQLGLGNSTDVPLGTLPSGNATVNLGGTAAIAIAAGADVSCAILQSGSVRCWGQNVGGDLGLGNTNTITVPADVPLGATATAIGVGDHACTLLSTPSVRCWGYNGFGELGLSRKTTFSATHPPNDYNPVPFPASYSPSFLAVGGGHTCVRLTPNSQLQCCGLNASGQLGLGLDPSVAFHSAIGDDESPTVGQVITNGQGVSSVVTGGSHTCVIYASDSGLRCWGDNSRAQLGLPNTNNIGTSASTLPNSLSPIKFTGGTVSSVYAGGGHTCVLLSNGQVRCWGWNNLGQLGLGYLSGTTPGTPDYVGGVPGWSPDQVADVKVFHP
jgi:cysteine-rich repeat protein